MLIVFLVKCFEVGLLGLLSDVWCMILGILEVVCMGCEGGCRLFVVWRELFIYKDIYEKVIVG